MNDWKNKFGYKTVYELFFLNLKNTTKSLPTSVISPGKLRLLMN